MEFGPIFLTLYFCTKLATGSCVAVHPPIDEFSEMAICGHVGALLARDWLARHEKWATLGGSCDPERHRFHNERPW